MADVNATFNYDANFGSALSQIKTLSKELSSLNNSFNSLDKNARVLRNDLANTFTSAAGQIGGFGARTVTITSDLDNFGKALDKNKLKLRDYYREATRAFSANSNARKLAEDQVRRTKGQLVEMGMDSEGRRKGILVTPMRLDMTDMNNQLQVARKQFDIFNRLIQDGATQLINWGKNTQWAGRQLTVGLTVPMTIFASTTIKAFNDVDKELTRFQKVYGSDLVAATTQATNEMRNQIQLLAIDIASKYGIAAKETAALAADLAATGLEGKKLTDSIKETTRLAVLGELDRQDAMATTLSLQNAFNMSTKELAESIDFLNAVENQTSVSLQDLTVAIPKVGPVIESLGGDVKDLSVLLVAMKEGGINAAEGANALKSGLASLINPTKSASAIAKQYGIDLQGIVTRNKGQLMPTLLEFQSSLQTIDDFGKAKIIEQLFGKYQFARISALFDNLNAQGSQTIEVMKLMGASSADLARIADGEIKTLTESTSMRFQRAMEGIKASLLPIGETITRSVIPFMEKFANFMGKIVEFGKNLPEPVKNFLKFTAGITAIAGPLVMITGVLANFLGYVTKGAMGFVNLGRRLAGLPTKQFSLLDDEQIAAAKATDTLTISIQNQASAMTKLVALMRDYNSTLVAQRAATPGAFSQIPLDTNPRRGGPRGGAPIRRQEGGPAYVPGSGSGDKVKALLEPGEFVVNREATKQYGGLLEDINNGTPRFQRGGALKMARAGYAVASGPGVFNRQTKTPMSPSQQAATSNRQQIEAEIQRKIASSDDLNSLVPLILESFFQTTGRSKGRTSKLFQSSRTSATSKLENIGINNLRVGRNSPENVSAVTSILKNIANDKSMTVDDRKALLSLVASGDAPADTKLRFALSRAIQPGFDSGDFSNLSPAFQAKLAGLAVGPKYYQTRTLDEILGNIEVQSKNRSISGMPKKERDRFISAKESLYSQSFPQQSRDRAAREIETMLIKNGVDPYEAKKLSQQIHTSQVSHFQSGGVIRAQRGIKMPDAYASKLSTVKQSMSAANAEAMASKLPIVDLGTRQSRIGGFSSAIPGVNGVYEINGQRYVVKGHDTEESALAEANMARITRDVFGLKTPNQEVVRVKHPETGDLLFAVRSPYDEAFAKTTGRFTQDSAFDQLIASVVRRDKDLQADNLFDNIVSDVGQAGIMSKASQPRVKTGPTNSALEQLAINLGMTKGGARSHGAEAWNFATANMTDAQIIARIKEAAAKAKSRLDSADIPQDFKYIAKDLDDIASADLAPFVAHLRTVFPKEKKPPTEAALIKKAKQKELDREERESALAAGFPAWALQNGGSIPKFRFGGRFANMQPSNLPKSEYKKLVGSAYQRGNAEISRTEPAMPTFGGGSRGVQAGPDRVPTYTINGKTFAFEGRGDNFAELTSKGISTVKTTPQGLLEEAIRLNPKDQNLQTMLKNINNKDFNEPEIQLLDNIAASISVGRRGNPVQGNENVDGFAMVLSALAGNESAKRLVDERTRNYYKIMQAKKAEEAKRHSSQRGNFTGDIDTADIPAIHSTQYPVVRDADGNVNIYPLGQHTLGTSQSVPRASVHLTLEAPVVPHMLMAQSGNENKVVTRLSSMMKDNDMPYALNPTDTWWTRSPGQALKMSDASVIRPFQNRRDYESELKSRGLPTGTSSTPILAVDPKTKDILFLRKEEYNEDDRMQMSKLSEELDLRFISAVNKDNSRIQVDTNDANALVGFENQIIDTLSMQLAKKQIGIDSQPQILEQHGLANTQLNERIFALANRNSISTQPHSMSGPERLETASNQSVIPRYTKLDYGTLEGTRMATAAGAFGSTKMEPKRTNFANLGVQSGGMIRAQEGVDTSPWVPGSGDGDRIPALLEPGEFVVNKKAAKQYGGLLHDINFNEAPRFQSGGMSGMPGMKTGAISMAAMSIGFMGPMVGMGEGMQKLSMVIASLTGVMSAFQMIMMKNNATGAAAGAGGLLQRGATNRGTGRALMKGSAPLAPVSGLARAGQVASGAGKFAMGALMSGPGLLAVAAIAGAAFAWKKYRDEAEEARKATEQAFSVGEKTAQAYGYELTKIGDKLKENAAITKQMGINSSQITSAMIVDEEKKAAILEDNAALIKDLKEKEAAGALTAADIPARGNVVSVQKDPEAVQQATDQTKSQLLTKYASLRQQGVSAADANEIITTIARDAGDNTISALLDLRPTLEQMNGDNFNEVFKLAQEAQLRGLKTMDTSTTGGDKAFKEAITSSMDVIQYAPPEDQLLALNKLIDSMKNFNSDQVVLAGQALAEAAAVAYGTKSGMGEALQTLFKSGDVDKIAMGAEIDTLLKSNAITANQQIELQLAIKEGDDDKVNSIIDPILKDRNIKINMTVEMQKDAQARIEEINKQITAQQAKFDGQMIANDNAVEAENARYENAQKAHEAFIKQKQKEIEAINKSADSYIKALQDEQRADAFAQQQRDTALGGLKSLASGDVFGFVQSQQEMAGAAQQFGFESEIKAIDERRQAAVDAKQAEIEKVQELAATEDERHENRLKALEKQRIAQIQANGDIMKGFQAQQGALEQISGMSGTAFTGITEGFATVDIEANKVGASAAAVNYMLANPKATVEQAIAEGRKYMESKAQSPGANFTNVGGDIGAGPGTTSSSTNPSSGGESKVSKASGGYISGAGGPKADLIPARLSNGEYVVQASAVDAYGVGMMDSINEQRFADGGPVDLNPRRPGKQLGDPSTKAKVAIAEKEWGETFDIMKGGYLKADKYSGKTHTGGGVFDAFYGGGSKLFPVEAVKALRKAGFAAWNRWQFGDNNRHIHAIEIGSKTLSKSAKNQVSDYLRGGDGMGGKDTLSNKYDLPDTSSSTAPDEVAPNLDRIAEAMGTTAEVYNKVKSEGLASLVGRRFGGSMTMNKPYMVGENGPEVVMPYGSGGRVVPIKYNVPAMASGGIINGGMGSASPQINVTVNGVNDPKQAADRAAQLINSEMNRRKFSRSIV